MGVRGQAHTLEAVVASTLLLTSLVFTLQMTAVTPLSASTSSQHIENQQRATGSGALASAAAEGELKRAVLYWNNTTEAYHDINADQGFYTSGPPDNVFGSILERSFSRRGIAYNVNFYYQIDDGTTERDIYIYSGVPSDNAVSSTHTVTLRADDHLVDADGTRNRTTLEQAGNFSVPAVGRHTHNTVRVEVVAWRI